MKKTVIFIIILSVPFACNVLDQEPISSISSANFWKTADDAEAGMVAVYDALQNTLSVNYLHWGTTRSDAFDIDNLGGAAPVNIVNNSLNPEVGSAYWANLYDVISKANFVLDNVPEIAELTENRKDQLLGEAYFLRAFAYFTAVRLWGDVPLILRSYTSADQEFFVTRTNANEVLDHVLMDIDNAGGLLQVDINNKGRATLGAVKALEAHFHAWRKDYGNAITAIDALLGMGYDLVSRQNYGSLLEPGNTSESVFELQYGFENQEVNGLANLFLVQPYLPGIFTILPPSPKILNLYEPNDVRFTTFFDSSQVNGLVYIKKYFGNPNVSTFNVPDDNLIIYRLADMILLKAEALNETNQPGPAMALVNQIRARAGMSDLPTGTKEEVKEIILNERFKELYCEGHRWYDLVRNDRAVQEIETLSSEEAILWPVHIEALNRNRNLTQNEYYK